MAEITGSFSTGNVTSVHDLRKPGDNVPENVSPDLTRDNVILIDNLKGKSPEQYINDLYQSEIVKYNLSQKREDRKIHLRNISEFRSPIDSDGNAKFPEYTGYCDYHRSKLKGDIFHETVIQIGEHSTLGKKYFDAVDGSHAENFSEASQKNYQRDRDHLHKMFTDQYTNILEKFQKANPHIHVMWAVIHFDEKNGTPHMHVGYFGDGNNFEKGLKNRVSLSRALTLDGIPRSEKRKAPEGFQLARWYRKLHDEIIQPEINSHLPEYESILGESVSIKPYQGGTHVDSRLLDAKDIDKVRAEKKQLDTEKEQFASDRKSFAADMEKKNQEIDDAWDDFNTETHDAHEKNLMADEREELISWQWDHDREEARRYLGAAKRVLETAKQTLRDAKKDTSLEAFCRMDVRPVPLTNGSYMDMPTYDYYSIWKEARDKETRREIQKSEEKVFSIGQQLDAEENPYGQDEDYLDLDSVRRRRDAVRKGTKAQPAASAADSRQSGRNGMEDMGS